MTPRSPGGFAALLTAFLGHAGFRAAIAIALIAAGALLEGAGLLLLVPALSILLDDPTHAGAGHIVDRLVRLLPTGDTAGHIETLLVVFAALILTRAAVLVARDDMLARLQHGFVEAFRLRLIDHIARAPWQTTATLPRARVVQVLGSEVQQVGVAAHFLLHGTVALVMLAIHIALAVALAPQLAIAAIVLLCPAAILGWRLMPRIRRLGAAVIVDHEHMTGETMRFLDGLKAAAAHNMQPAFVAEHRRLSDAALANRRDFFRVQARSRHLTSAAVALAGAAAVLLGATALRLDPAVLIVLIVILARTGTPALLLQQSAEQIAHCLPAFAAAQAMEAECGTRRPFPPAHRIPRHGTGPSLLFDRVTFLHPAREGAHPGGIRQVDAMVPAGALIGIAGPSGAGKTSFVDLAAGLLMPHEGAVLIDGVRLTPDRLAIHRDRIGYAGRDPFLFGGTFRHNLLWGTPERSDDAILEALDRVGAAQLVRSRGGLDARIDEHRLTLSAGEGQRLAIARLLLRAAPLLILDEATASLDIGSERRALHALRESLCRPTILLVSHRAETLAQCDAVLRFDAGALAPATEPLSVARASTA